MKLYRVRISTLISAIVFIALALGCGLLASRLSDAESRNAALLANLQSARNSIVVAEFQRQAAEELHERFVDALAKRGVITPEQIRRIEAETGEDAIKASEGRAMAEINPANP